VLAIAASAVPRLIAVVVLRRRPLIGDGDHPWAAARGGRLSVGAGERNEFGVVAESCLVRCVGPGGSDPAGGLKPGHDHD